MVFITLASVILFYYYNVLLNPVTDLIMTIEGVIIADFIITEVTRPLREPEISVEPTSKMFDLGFVVTLKDKNILNATAYCDGTRFNWQERDGKESQTKTLLVGDIGATFYPFKIELANNQVADEYQIVEFSIKQKITNMEKIFKRVSREKFSMIITKFREELSMD